MLQLKEISHKYMDRSPFEFSLKLDKSDSLAVIGPSGAGKSTLLNLISGFATATRGKILFAGEDITNFAPNLRPVNILFQDNNLFLHLNAFDNIAIGLSPNLKINSTQKEIVEQALERVGLSGFNKRFPHQLSGGQKQRIALARTLVRKKEILLLDEPFSFLDPPLRIEMLDLVKSLQKENQFITIMVTHDYNDALRICNKSCFLQNGRIIYTNQTDKFIAESKISEIKSYTT
jgi:thiamine transport system ATP-binding protein